MTIKKISLYINAFLILSIAVAIYTVVNLASAFGALEDVTRKKEILLMLGDELKQSSAELTNNVRLFAVTGDKQYQDAYNAVLNERSGKIPRFNERKLFPGESHALLQLLGRYGVSDVELGYVREAENLSNKLVPLEEEAMRLTQSAIDGKASPVALKDSPERQQAMGLLYQGTYIVDLVPIVQSMNKFTSELDRRTSEQVAACETDVALYIKIMGSALVMMLLAAMASILFSQKKIITPLIVTTQFAAEVSGGNLEKKIDAPDNNEIGTLRNTLNSMVENLKKHIDNAKKESEHATEESQKAQQAMLHAESMSKESEAKSESILVAAQKLEDVVEVMATSMKRLTEQIGNSGDGATKQAARLAETAMAMEEMNSAVLQVAQKARTASEVSNATRQKAEDGSQTVHKAVEGILEVQRHALKLKNEMSELDENAKAINQIMNVISDIADQTNLLALNAAIEAARAGEAGRGFAVVADEVRKLAEKTMASTAEVAKAIGAIQNSASASMNQMDVSVKAIENSTTFVNASGVVLKEIMDLAENTASQVKDIAAAADQQSSASVEINRSISAIHSISSDTAKSMQEADGVVQELSRQTEVVEGLIEHMEKV